MAQHWIWLQVGSFMIFQRPRISVAKEPYIFVIFQGVGVRTPCPPPIWIRAMISTMSIGTNHVVKWGFGTYMYFIFKQPRSAYTTYGCWWRLIGEKGYLDVRVHNLRSLCLVSGLKLYLILYVVFTSIGGSVKTVEGAYGYTIYLAMLFLRLEVWLKLLVLSLSFLQTCTIT